jgi:hypothetical protein
MYTLIIKKDLGLMTVILVTKEAEIRRMAEDRRGK